MIEQCPQPWYDVEMAKISAWLVERGYTCHVTLKGALTLRKKEPHFR